MGIDQIDNGAKGYFRASEGGEEIGRMTYTWAGEKKLIIDHTEVDPAFKGRNVGKQLLMAFVSFARKNSVKVIPVCPFASAMFRKMKEIGDVLY